MIACQLYVAVGCGRLLTATEQFMDWRLSQWDPCVERPLLTLTSFDDCREERQTESPSHTQS